ncbi:MULTISPECIES: ABC transporter permease [unclassified Curtobacterium]|uniref:ABC transporter permease n=1 Tax=unclassified Curtobacterium TaxID=257496 RepID=UPI000DAA5B8C|nr:MULTISPECIES: ABC transporter permease [unclassified Curtobacterium]PZE26411.1 ABC transporter permease [Curtobacterium sp. MCBD17_028]PZE75069.1 ABC transporter permease [Curtobacterium sp. MCBD17_019]PZF64447.1 ABC transporter permease [Curtobacterium sp. MCBD17_013]WIB62561.1 ABC transporter permease [Curtobacterium sp. MCBD17_040]WIB66398.1 ABC transporter permease [Curtobacterium sp. MCBD17_035]
MSTTIADRTVADRTVADRFARLRTEQLVPAGRTAGGTWGSVREIHGQRQLLDLLIRRDLKSRYKDSALGFAWSLIRPLVQLGIYWLILGKILGSSRAIPEFAIYVFAGLTLYGLFSEIVSGATGSVVANAGLLKKVYVPREIYPLSAVGGALFNFGIQMVILLIATAAFRSFPMNEGILFFFPATLVILIWATAIGLLFSALNVYLRDMAYLVEVLMMLFMWASPIVYSWQMVHDRAIAAGISWILPIYENNPVTLAILGFHRAFWTAGGPEQYPDHMLLRLVIAGVVGLVALFFCQRAFARLQGNFAQEI